MITLLRRVRQKFFNQNRFSKYLIYALGEFLLVVIGILTAIQINNWNRNNKLLGEELEAYDIIIKDLKRDSTLFLRYQKTYNRYLDTYFKLNKTKKTNGSFKDIFTDDLCSNAEFNPAVQKNNLPIIDKLRNQNVRDKINGYFRKLNLTHMATEEFNSIIVNKSRPYFIQEYNIFNNNTVFDDTDRTFPPFKEVSVIDTIKLRKTLNTKYFTPIISELRMSIGFYLIALEFSIRDNAELIAILRDELSENQQ